MPTLIAGLFSTIGVVAVVSALALASVASAATLSSLQVVVGPVLAWLWLGETLNVVMAAGITLMLIGVIIVQRAKTPATSRDATPR